MERKSEPVLITPDMLAHEADRRVDFERGMRHAPPLTLGLILAMSWLYVTQLWSAYTLRADYSAVIDRYALVRDKVMAGEWWRGITAAFLHGSPDHLMGNVVSLYILGMGCEHAFGIGGMAILFLGSALGGSAASIALSSGPSVGASGAVFGLMGALVYTLHRHQDVIFVRDKRIGVVIAVWAAYTFIVGAMSPMVDNAAHLGGLVAGASLAALLPTHLSRKA